MYIFFSSFVRPFCVVLIFTSSMRAEVALPSIISDHMVLQQGVEVPIWGTAKSGEEISVSIADQFKQTKADLAGKWMVRLSPIKMDEGLTLTVKGNNTIVVRDILIGDVWLGAGQSNMLGYSKAYLKDDQGLQKILLAAPYPRIRMLRSGDKGWMVATHQNVENFSALMLSFGVSLQDNLNIPLGLVVGAVGGTPSGAWLTEEMYKSDIVSQKQIVEFSKTYDYKNEMDFYLKNMREWEINAEKAKADGRQLPFKPVMPRNPGESENEKGYLYNKHIVPFIPFAIRGVLWDQGEGGTGITGLDQRHAMSALIKGWRGAWGSDFPFIYMQKPSGGGVAFDPTDPITKQASPFEPLPNNPPATKYGVAREDFLHVRKISNTEMVPTTDLGGNTHPVNKSGYGSRAARVALGFVYKRPLEFSGPLYESHSIKEDKVYVTFSHVGKGLAPRHGDRLQGFAIAGSDKKFVWADAVIDGDCVVVSSRLIRRPEAVRYAWGRDSPWANLFNLDGLPAQIFRTDDWK